MSEFSIWRQIHGWQGGWASGASVSSAHHVRPGEGTKMGAVEAEASPATEASRQAQQLALSATDIPLHGISSSKEDLSNRWHICDSIPSQNLLVYQHHRPSCRMVRMNLSVTQSADHFASAKHEKTQLDVKQAWCICCLCSDAKSS